MIAFKFVQRFFELGLIGGALWVGSAQAGVCEMTTKRVACPGKETESFKKCGGKADCITKKKVGSAEECAETALKECPNSRLDITKSKEIKAKFDGADVKSKTGDLNFCEPTRPDFNKC